MSRTAPPDTVPRCDEVDALSASPLAGTQEELQQELARHRPFLSKTVGMQAMLQSKNNVFQSILKNTEGKEGIDCAAITARMGALNARFEGCLTKLRGLEQSLSGGVGAWGAFHQAEKDVETWISEAESLIHARHVESKDGVEMHRIFFDRNVDHVMETLVKADQALQERLQAKEDKARTKREIHKKYLQL